MGTIRETEKKDGTKAHHAEVRLRGSAPQRASFRTRSLGRGLRSKGTQKYFS